MVKVLNVLWFGTALVCAGAASGSVTNNVTITDALSRSTVRICCGRTDTNAVSIGTAFMVLLKHDARTGSSVPVFVTNKHVIKGSHFIQFSFSEVGPRETAPRQIPVSLPLGEGAWKFHPDPDVDLCAMPIAPILRIANERKLNVDIAPLPLSLATDEEGLKDFRQLDEVVMVGYPDGYIDGYNNQPIFRKGVIATDPVKDYQHKKEFLVDIAVYPGSSGSPVLVLREGVYYDRNSGNAMVSKGKGWCKLIGVLYAGHVHDVTGRPVPVPVPTSMTRSQPWVPNNLGIVIKAERVKELERLF